jgi:hypothetical protein
VPAGRAKTEVIAGIPEEDLPLDMDERRTYIAKHNVEAVATKTKEQS